MEVSQVQEPACARNLPASFPTVGKSPCGEGLLQCPVEHTVSPVSIGVMATEATRSVITPIPPVHYFFEVWLRLGSLQPALHNFIALLHFSMTGLLCSPCFPQLLP